MIVKYAAFKDRTSAQQKKIVAPLVKQGYCYSSLSIYGDPASPLYAGVMLLRDTTVTQQSRWDMDAPACESAFNEMANMKLAPTVITATGTASNPRFAVIFEPAPEGVIPRSLINLNQQAFDQENADALARGDILRAAAMYGSSISERRYAAVWWPNPSKVLWRVFTDDDFLTTQQKFEAMLSQWGRLAIISRSADGHYLTMYRDDSTGRFVALSELTGAQYQDNFDKLTVQGYFPIYVQAVGNSASGARFAVIFAQGEDVLPRKFTVTGTSEPKLKPFDDLMKLVLKRGGGRAAALAITHNGELIHARGYTWADQQYPVTQPDSLFGIASCSKALTAIVTHQLFEQGLLSPDDFVQPILNLTPPPNMKFTGYDPGTKTSWVDKIQIKHLLNHTSGLHHSSPDVLTVATAFGHPNNYTLTKREYLSHSLCDMRFPPGGPVPAGVSNYSNTGYLLLGLVLEAKTGLPYEQAMQKFLFKPLSITTAQVGRALAKDRAPKEVFYHTHTFDVGKSQVTSDRPYVATQYGAGGDLRVLNDASGGLIISAADCARVLAVFDHSPAAPVFKKPETATALWNCGVWEGVSPYQNGKDSAGKDTSTLIKGGGMGGINAVILRRDDNFSVAAFLAYSIWPSDPEMSLSGLDATWGSFQINERLNVYNGSTPVSPLLRKWKLNSDGVEAEFVIESVDENNNFGGKIVEASRSDPVRGIWHKAAHKLVFTRQTGNSDPTKVRIYTGYLMTHDNRMAGTFEAFTGSGATAKQSIYGWTAELA